MGTKSPNPFVSSTFFHGWSHSPRSHSEVKRVDPQTAHTIRDPFLRRRWPRFGGHRWTPLRPLTLPPCVEPGFLANRQAGQSCMTYDMAPMSWSFTRNDPKWRVSFFSDRFSMVFRSCSTTHHCGPGTGRPRSDGSEQSFLGGAVIRNLTQEIGKE